MLAEELNLDVFLGLWRKPVKIVEEIFKKYTLCMCVHMLS